MRPHRRLERGMLEDGGYRGISALVELSAPTQ